MRICIDATSLLLRSAGVKNYVYHWMRSLRREAPEHTITAFPALGDVGDLDHERSVLSPGKTYPRLALLHFLNIRYNPAINALTRGVDVFHASNQLRNLPRRPKLTATIFDMTAKLFPQFHTAGNVKAESSLYDNVLSRADGLIAISQSSKDDAVRLLGLNADRVAVVYPGIDERFFDVSQSEILRVRAKNGLDKPYALFVGTVEPRKNVDTLLDAWTELPLDIRDAYALVIAGPIGWASGATVARLQSGIAGVRVLGYIPESDLPGLTAGATVFVYPSFYEGFGFPVAQAMAAGVPTITSNVSALPEITAGSARLVSPQSTIELSSALQNLFTSPSTRAALTARCIDAARRYTWRNAAIQSKAFFSRL
jgi:glycosyltransferase involved in cell wall biosynthesis